MKVIFLDIDGVMNTEKRSEELWALVQEGKMSKEEYYETWDLPFDDTALPLKKIVDSTGAVLVLSSSWRNIPKSVERLSESLKRYDMELFGTTCRGVPLETVVELGFDPDNCHSVYNFRNCQEGEFTFDRGAEIAYWLKQHPDVDSFVILDDDIADIKPYYKKEHIRTSFTEDGLTYELAEKAIKILNRKKRRKD